MTIFRHDANLACRGSRQSRQLRQFLEWRWWFLAGGKRPDEQAKSLSNLNPAFNSVGPIPPMPTALYGFVVQEIEQNYKSELRDWPTDLVFSVTPTTITTLVVSHFRTRNCLSLPSSIVPLSVCR